MCLFYVFSAYLEVQLALDNLLLQVAGQRWVQLLMKKKRGRNSFKTTVEFLECSLNESMNENRDHELFIIEIKVASKFLIKTTSLTYS